MKYLIRFTTVGSGHVWLSADNEKQARTKFDAGLVDGDLVQDDWAIDFVESVEVKE